MASTIPSMVTESQFASTDPSLAIGFNVESVVIKNVKFQMWDLGGQSSIRCSRPPPPDDEATNASCPFSPV